MNRKTIKRLIFWGAQAAGTYNLTRKWKTGATAFFYHGIEEKIIDPRVQEVHLSFELFEKQIEYLRKNYEIISLDYLYDCLANGYRISPSQVLLTFDDGYKNNATIVMPFLKSYDIPFSVFICTNNIDRGLRFPTYYLRASIFYTIQKHINIRSINREFNISTEEKRINAKNVLERFLKGKPQNIVDSIVKELTGLIPDSRWKEIDNKFSSDVPMNWEDVRKLHDLGVVVGSHCHDHFIIHKGQNRPDIDYQLKTSKNLIEKFLGECKYFSYPNGNMEYLNLDSLGSLKENNYVLGFTIIDGEIGNCSNPYLLPRVGAPADLDHFKFKINTSFRHNKQFRNWSLKFGNI